MARQKISEFKAKTLLCNFLGLAYTGITASSANFAQKISQLPDTSTYVVKVDQGVKGRFKKGLVVLDLKKDDLSGQITNFVTKGYTLFVIEPYVGHEAKQERYLSLSRERGGIRVLYSEKGGIDIETNKDLIHEEYIQNSSDGKITSIASLFALDSRLLVKLVDAFDLLFFSFLEINPFLVEHESAVFLDLAVEVDSAGEFFVNGKWTADDFVGETGANTVEEQRVTDLKEKSQASFKLNVLNESGSIFVLLSGGGASLVVADEAYNLGFGKELANYGEYSGNPNEEETYMYTKNLLSLLLKSKASKKVLIIGGGVANFTDIRLTFRGIIRALGEVKDELYKKGVKVYVRRGGPNQEEGLAQMRGFLQDNNLLGDVRGPDMVLTDIVKEAVDSL